MIIFNINLLRRSHRRNDARSAMTPDSKVHGANMGPTWDLSAPDGPHVGPMNIAIWGLGTETITTSSFVG